MNHHLWILNQPARFPEILFLCFLFFSFHFCDIVLHIAVFMAFKNIYLLL